MTTARRRALAVLAFTVLATTACTTHTAHSIPGTPQPGWATPSDNLTDPLATCNQSRSELSQPAESRSDGSPQACPPAFPRTVEGYELADEWRTTIRAFTGDTWVSSSSFPATMNGCDQQRFYVRWRAPQSVEATFRSMDGIALSDPATGTAGFMSSYGCSRPSFQVATSVGGSTLVDVVVEVQRWSSCVC